jgi:putative membrane protein
MLKRLMLVSLVAAMAACTHHERDRDRDANGDRMDRDQATSRTPMDRPGQTRATTNSSRLGPATELDFLREASMGGLMEVTLGRMARERAASPDVRQFGQRMIDDHTRANADLMTLARSTGVNPPKTLDAEHQQMVDRVSGLIGEAFDREYMRMMVQDHIKDVSQFERQAANAGNAEISLFAQRTLPVLRQHLEMARDIAKRVGVSND